MFGTARVLPRGPRIPPAAADFPFKGVHLDAGGMSSGVFPYRPRLRPWVAHGHRAGATKLAVRTQRAGG